MRTIANEGGVVVLLRRLLSTLGLAGDLHFAWFTLGGGSIAGAVVSGGAAVVTALPWWSLIPLFLGTFLLAAGFLGLIVRSLKGRATARDALASARSADAPGKKAKKELAEWRRATDMAVTWLYRRENWPTLSADGRGWEPAPAEWARKKYAAIGLEHDYKPPVSVGGEPEFSPPGAPGSPRANVSATPAPATDRAADSTRPSALAGVPPEHRAGKVVEYREARAQLIKAGKEREAELWALASSEASAKGAESVAYAPVSQWEDNLANFRNLWWHGDDSLEAALDAAEPDKPTIGPPWRAAQARRIRRGMAWLEARDVSEVAQE